MVLEDVAGFLTDHALGTLGATLFLSLIPPAPDSLTAIFEYSGEPSERVLGPGQAVKLERPNVQVICRAIAYDVARAAAQARYAILDGADFVTAAGVRYVIAALQPPFFLQRDENDRILIGFNCGIQKGLTP